MKLETILKLVEGVVVTQSELEGEINFGLTSDLMSDVLTLDIDDAMLITGLNNLQTIRTAEMSDIHCVLIARNKKVSKEMIDLANQSNIVIIESPFGVFKVSGILYAKNIKPAY
ncbi:MAG: hypothetical protein PF517_16685 [Salinivirgaceae bacterium]|jgi:predicted transcriptional regulator|nr:hypothetical protein [Salinivirgaceae bacterium]